MDCLCASMVLTTILLLFELFLLLVQSSLLVFDSLSLRGRSFEMFRPDQPVCAFAEEVEKAAKRRADKHENAPEILFLYVNLLFDPRTI